MTEYERRVIHLLTVLVNGQVALMSCQSQAQRPDISEMIAHQRELADLLIAELPKPAGESIRSGE